MIKKDVVLMIELYESQQNVARNLMGIRTLRCNLLRSKMLFDCTRGEIKKHYSISCGTRRIGVWLGFPRTEICIVHDNYIHTHSKRFLELSKIL